MTQAVATGNATTQARQQVESTVRALYDAWQARDERKIRQFFVDDDELFLWGTDVFERIVGRAEADREFASWVATCPPWTSIGQTFRVMDVDGTTAWVADDVTGQWSRGTDSSSESYRITTIWRNVGNDWKLVHANFASPH